jgi:DNA-binding NarL/FixJ family response regulator
MIRVAIIEDDTVIREGVEAYLNAQEDMCCIAARESVELFLAVLDPKAPPDVILMDIGLPGMSGISGIKIITDKHPEVNVIMFTIYHDPHKIFDSLCAGASGYLLKNTPLKELHDAIKIIAEGGSFMSPPIARKVIEHFRQGGKKPVASPLTDKEREIVMGLTDGLSYKMIADTACISLETVRSHIKNIYRKLHVHSKAEVIRKSLSGEI